MKHRIAPTKLAIVQTLTGHKVRILKTDLMRENVQVKSLVTGLPFWTTPDQLRPL
ncbi:hypothetical protein [Hymenobacter defluvii]|uniref:Uncharacterized protein n=1 Tax=Hymenobacter defluvii TaxID=2054411 RepID=A0ABS3TAT0_9BACT|nr:hypothetical protein [Hymenobacter defluvii]MBO3270759.1 hypothetical protein [Hymenobacter defluvii]